jgi:hypothetical protein
VRLSSSLSLKLEAPGLVSILEPIIKCEVVSKFAFKWVNLHRYDMVYTKSFTSEKGFFTAEELVVRQRTLNAVDP